LHRRKSWLHLPASVRIYLHRLTDRTLGGLLLLGAGAHAYGSFRSYPVLSETLVWSLSGSLAMMLLAGLNLLRVGRPQDKTLAWICFAGCVGWAAIAIGFGVAINHLFDARVIYHGVVALALADYSFTTATGREMAAKTAPAPQNQDEAVTPPDVPVALPRHEGVRVPVPPGRAAYRASRSHGSRVSYSRPEADRSTEPPERSEASRA
jgi:hypothetical protein